MARPLKKTSVKMENGIHLVADQGFDRPKGRHWIAWREGVMIGEFRTWQVSKYAPRERPADQDVSDYGRGTGDSTTHMVKQSWIAAEFLPPGAPIETAEEPNTERKQREWQAVLLKAPHPALRRRIIPVQLSS